MGAITLAASGGHMGPISRLWRSYERTLRRHPVATQSVTSALLWGLGDLAAQKLKQRAPLDGRRIVLTGAFGAAVIGPAGHAWYTFLDKFCLHFGPAGTATFLLAKVMLDNAVYGPAYVAAFLAYGCAVIDGLDLPGTQRKLRSELMPTLAAEALLWPPIMALIFSRVATRHQLLAVNTVTLADVAFLSWMRDQEDFSGALLEGLKGLLRGPQPGSALQQKRRPKPQRQKQQAHDGQRHEDWQRMLLDDFPEPSLVQFAFASATASSCGMSRSSSSR